MTSKLSPEDQQKVDRYLSAPQHQVERKPFRPLLMLAVVLLIVLALGVLSRMLSLLVD